MSHKIEQLNPPSHTLAVSVRENALPSYTEIWNTIFHLQEGENQPRDPQILVNFNASLEEWLKDDSLNSPRDTYLRRVFQILIRFLIQDGSPGQQQVKNFFSLAIQSGKDRKACIILECLEAYHMSGSCPFEDYIVSACEKKMSLFLLMLVERRFYTNSIVEPKTQMYFLHLASLHNLPRVAQALLDAGARPEVKDVNGDTPFHLAARNGHTNVVNIFLRHPDCIPLKAIENNSKHIPFHSACEAEDISTIRFLMPADPRQLPLGLYLACAQGHQEIVRLLVENHHARLDHPEYHPCFASITHRRFETTQYLLTQPQLPLQTCFTYAEYKNLSLLGLACACELDEATIKLIAEKITVIKSPDDLFVICRKKMTFLITEDDQLDPKLDVKAKDSQGNTLVHAACSAGDDNLLKIFLEKFKDSLKSKNNEGQIPLHILCREGHVNCFALVKGSGLNAEDNEKNTPLHLAVLHQRIPILRMLKNEGADFSKRNSKKETPLDLALGNKNLYEMVLFLIQMDKILTELKSHQKLLSFFEYLLTKNVLEDTPANQAIKNLVTSLYPHLNQKEWIFSHPFSSASNNFGMLRHLFKYVIKREDIPALLERRDSFGKTLVEETIDFNSISCTLLLLSIYPSLRTLSPDALNLACKNNLFPVITTLLRLATKEESSSVLIDNVELKYKHLIFISACLIGNKTLALHFLHEFEKLLLAAENERGLPISTEMAKEFFNVVIKGKTFLHYACMHPNCQDVVLKILSFPGIKFTQDNFGRLPIHYACENRLEAAVIRMIELGSPLDCRDNSGQTALHLACFYGLNNAAQKMLERGSNVRLKDEMQVPPLHYALDQEKFTNVALNLLQKQRKAISHVDNFGNFPLLLAIENRDEHVCKLILKQMQDSEDFSQIIEFGDKLLPAACEMDLFKIALKLIRCGAKIDCLSLYHKKRLLAYVHKTEDYADEIEKLWKVCGENPLEFRYVKGTTLHETIELCLHAQYRELLNNSKTDFNAKNGLKQTPLHLACTWMDDLKPLVDAGAKIDVVDCRKKTPLHVACTFRNNEAAIFLLNQKADPLCADIDGNTPLSIAMEKRLYAVVELIYQYHGKTWKKGDIIIDHLIFWAIIHNRNALLRNIILNEFPDLRLATIFLQHFKHETNDGFIDLLHSRNYSSKDETLDKCYSHWKTKRMPLKASSRLAFEREPNALEVAVRYNRFEPVYLLTNFISKLEPECIGEMPLVMFYACKTGNVKLVYFFLEKGIGKLSSKDNEGNTLLHLVCRFNDHEELFIMLTTDPQLNIEVKNAKGNTPMFELAERKINKSNSDFLRISCRQLLERGANCLSKNNVGKTALHVACNSQNAIVVEEIIRKYLSSLNISSKELLEAIKMKDDQGNVPDLQFLLDRESFSNMSFIVTQNDSERRIFVNSHILEARSLYFQRMFQNLRNGKINAILFEDQKALIDCLKYCYSSVLDFEGNQWPKSWKFYDESEESDTAPLLVKPSILQELLLSKIEEVNTPSKALFLQSLEELRIEKEQLESQPLSTLTSETFLREINMQTEHLKTLDDTKRSVANQINELNALIQKTPQGGDYEHMKSRLINLETHLFDIATQHSILWNEHKIRCMKADAIQRFKSHPNLLLFYRTVNIKLEEIFISFKSVAGGFVPHVAGDFAIVNSFLELFGNVAGLVPIVGDTLSKVFKIGGIVLKKWDDLRQKNTAMNASALVTFSEMKKYAESTARQLTEKYSEQLLLLPTPEEEHASTRTLPERLEEKVGVVTKAVHIPAAKQLAAFGVLWMVKELYDAHKIGLEEDLNSILISAISQKSPPEGIKEFWQKVKTVLKIDGLKLKNGATVTPEHLYTLPGIKIFNGSKEEYFSSPRHQPDIYGWRMGSMHDVQILRMERILNPRREGTPVLPVTSTSTSRQIQENHKELCGLKEQVEIILKTTRITEGASILAIQQLLEDLNERLRRLERNQGSGGK